MKHVPAPVPHEFRDRVPAEPGRLVGLRKQLSIWLAGLGVDGERQEDIVLASNEALANSAEHAYRDGTDGVIDIRATADRDEIEIVVTDYGNWKPANPADTIRGRGLLLIERLADHAECAYRGDGTTVTMTWTTSPRGGR
ncbi:ATP-binding protein [Amycolatopsis umgeniensis]|uniref:Anti-sigma regulatory factor (Ser/Thr protein kinase) n=1 Tax=Amycolatopsis umgeniensis TaxID=336628 RepID=A0A841AYB4_9PSEU|nr:ATP-binding protein [Amycolatopsis umgeniensis]MBB5851088.1 anti-sigma regulatory factor (Ser/Thr protein kinase) [Amycolatopsis umgeniensis]